MIKDKVTTKIYGLGPNARGISSPYTISYTNSNVAKLIDELGIDMIIEDAKQTIEEDIRDIYGLGLTNK
jgi:hypothetical protein